MFYLCSLYNPPPPKKKISWLRVTPHFHETVDVDVESMDENSLVQTRFGSVANQPPNRSRSFSLDSFDCMTTSSLAMYQNPVSQLKQREKAEVNLTKTHLELTAYRKIRSMLYVLVCIVFFLCVFFSKYHDIMQWFVRFVCFWFDCHSVSFVDFICVHLSYLCVCTCSIFTRVFRACAV